MVTSPSRYFAQSNKPSTLPASFPCICVCRFGTWSAKDIDHLNTYQLLTAKPVVYLVNLSKTDYIRKKVCEGKVNA